MLRVTIDMLPNGREDGRRTIGVIDIANDKTGDIETGNYTVTLYKNLVGKGGQAWKRGRVEGFSRRVLGPYDLVYLALRATVGTRNRIGTSTEKGATRP